MIIQVSLAIRGGLRSIEIWNPRTSEQTIYFAETVFFRPICGFFLFSSPRIVKIMSSKTANKGPFK